MKRIFVWIITVLLTLLAVVLSVKPLALLIVTNQLRNVFKGASVSLKGARLDFSSFDVAELDINSPGKYSIRIKDAVVGFRLSSVYGTTPITLMSKAISAYGVEAQDVCVRYGVKSRQGDVTVAMGTYDKITATLVAANFRLEENSLSFFGANGFVLNGRVSGEGSIRLGHEPRYRISVNCADVDIDRVVRDLNLAKKFNMTGKVSGHAAIKGSGKRIEALEGQFSTLTPGGTLTIHDVEALAGMAAKSRQPVELLVDSFRDYRYNTGLLSLGFEDNNAVLHIGLEGDTGRRNLDVVLHDLNLLLEGR